VVSDIVIIVLVPQILGALVEVVKMIVKHEDLETSKLKHQTERIRYITKFEGQMME